MATKEKKEREISYYELRLRELLNTSFPNLASDEEFIEARSDLAAQAYEDAFEAGNDILECRRIANEVLFKGLYFSPFDVVFRVVCNEFDKEIPDNELRSFALKMFPYCVEVFEEYNLHEDFEDSPEYDKLYTELTGQIQIWLENNGLQ